MAFTKIINGNTLGKNFPLPENIATNEDVLSPLFVAFSEFSQAAAAYSTDGITWTASSMPENALWQGIGYGDGKFLALLDYIYYSTDGINWTKSSSSQKSYTSVAYGSGKFVSTSITYTDWVISYSTDGITWSDVSIHPGTNLYTMNYLGGRFWGAGAQQYLTSGWTSVSSTDGITWSQASLPEIFPALAYGNGKFVAASQNTVFHSTNGITWTQSSFPQGENYSLSRIPPAFGSGKFAVIGYRSQEGVTVPRVALSTDGVTWEPRDIPLKSFPRSLIYGDGKFLATASDDSVAYSTDGLGWTEAKLPRSAPWKYVTLGYVKNKQTIKDRLNTKTQKL